MGVDVCQRVMCLYIRELKVLFSRSKGEIDWYYDDNHDNYAKDFEAKRSTEATGMCTQNEKMLATKGIYSSSMKELKGTYVRAEF